MRTGFVVIGLLLGAAANAAAQGTQDRPSAGAPLTVEVAVRGYLANGRAGSLAGDSGVDRLEGYVWANQTLCGLGAGDDAPSTTPWVGWQFTGSVVSDSPGQMVLQIDWQRVWDKGARIQNGPKGSERLTLRGGERVELDRIVPATTGACGTVEAKLEVLVAPRPAYLFLSGRGVAGGVSGGVPSASRGRGAAGGVAAGRGAGATTGARGGVASGVGSGAGQGGRGSLPYTLFSMRGAYDAEIWLVHRKPDGTEAVQQQTVRFSSAAREFAFPPIQIAGADGALTLDITGSLRSITLLAGSRGVGLFTGGRASGSRPAAGAQASTAAKLTASQTPMFAVSIARRVRRATPFLDTRGATDMSIEIPKPTDVFSFELPPLQKATEDLLKGHTFSIRLRMTQVK